MSGVGYFEKIALKALRQYRSGRPFRVFSMTLLAALAGLGLAPAARAQHGNIRLGGFEFNVEGSLESEFNDNINYSNANRQSDIIIRTGLTLTAFKQLTPINSVQLDLGMAYEQYIFHPNLSSYSNFADVAPNSQLAYTIEVDNFTIKLYDSFSFSAQPSDAFAVDPATGKVITNVRAFARFENQLGFNVDWDLDKLNPYIGGYRSDVFPMQSDFNYLRRTQYTGLFGVRYQLNPSLLVSLGGAYTVNAYQEHLDNNSASWFLGPEATWQPNNIWSIKFSGGYTFYDFIPTGTNGDMSQPNTFTFDLSINNKLTKLIDHTLDFSRTSSFGYTSNTLDINRVAYQVAWKFAQKMTARFWTYYQTTADSGGTTAENSTEFSFSPGIDYRYSSQTSFYINYEYLEKTSNFSDRIFDRNKLIIGVKHSF